MSNQMNLNGFNAAPSTLNPASIEAAFQNAMQNPAQFEAMVRSSNPQAYEMAMQIRNTSNPRDAIMRIAQSKGINPAMLLQMVGLK